jgi:hypothetical protein
MMRKLSITRLPAASKVLVLCRGKGSPFPRRTLTPRNGTVNVAPAFAMSDLQTRTIVQIEISARGMLGAEVAYTM